MILRIAAAPAQCISLCSDQWNWAQLLRVMSAQSRLDHILCCIKYNAPSPCTKLRVFARASLTFFQKKVWRSSLVCKHQSSTQDWCFSSSYIFLTQPVSKWTFNMPETVVISRFQRWSPLWNPSYFPVCPSMSRCEMSSFMNVSLCLESSVVPSSSLPFTEKKNSLTSPLKCFSMQLLLYMFIINIDSEPVILYCFVLSSALFGHWSVTIKHHLWKKNEKIVRISQNLWFWFSLQLFFCFALLSALYD